MPPRTSDTAPPQPRDVRDMLMYRVARLATIGDRTGQSRMSRQFGMNIGDWRVFGAIHAMAPVTLAGLARELYLDKGQISRTVSNLIDAGLVSHRASPDDRRQTLFETTAEGVRLHERVLAFITTRNADLLSALDAREQGEFFRLLDKVTETAARSYDDLFGPQARPAQAPAERTKTPRATRATGRIRKNVERASARATGS